MFEADILKRQNKYELPADTSQLEQLNIFKREDPSEFYEVVSRLNQGAYGQIFKVRRLVDGEFFALKFMWPKDVNDFNSIKNEVGIMMMC